MVEQTVVLHEVVNWRGREATSSVSRQGCGSYSLLGEDEDGYKKEGGERDEILALLWLLCILS
jgi:hypothetical protein